MIKNTDVGGGRRGPILFCDECGDRIADASDASVHLFADGHYRFIHYDCEGNHDGDQGSQDLTVWLFYLLTNVHMTPNELDHAREQARLLAEIG